MAGALKGDFYLGTLASTGRLGVVEDYTRCELDEERVGDGSELVPTRWTCTYLGEGLRLARTDGAAEGSRAANSVGACQILQAASAVAQIHDVPHGAYEGHRTILDVDVLGYVPRVRRQIDDSRANLQQLESSQRWSTGSLARPDLYDLHNLNPR